MEYLKEKAKVIFSVASEVAVAFFVIIIVAFLLSVLEGIITQRTVQAAELKGYEALPVTISGSGQLVMRPGERKTVSVSFQNIGSESWVNDGNGYVSVYTHDPKYRKSNFDPGTWLGPEQVKRLIEPEVAVGSVGSISFELHAPETKGSYTETFHLASEDTAWIPGGEFSFQIEVKEAVVTTQPDSSEPDKVIYYTGYHATPTFNQDDYYQVKPGGLVEFPVTILNTGSTSWSKRRIQLPDIRIASASDDYFHSSWLTRNILTARSKDIIKPGESEEVTIKFVAPEDKGLHLIRFQMVVDQTQIAGGEIDIPVEVTSDAPDVLNEPKIIQVDPIEEPTIRVGVLTVDEETDDMVQISCQSEMRLEDENGSPLANLVADQTVSAFYKDNRYYYDVGRGLEKSTYPIRFVSKTENAILTVENFDRRTTRNASYADNTFRNILEIRHSDVKGNIWLINELPMETYLKGLAETSNISHIEYQKALIVAARTYAFYHWQRGTKHDAEGYHVDAYADQVYKGAGQEARMPKLTQAVEDTFGVIVTHDGETAITPYFSRSDGRTRDWSEVWYGDVEWLQSVEVPHDAGKTLWGHGVGMSALGALGMANDGQTFEEIIKYFYQGVDLTKQWE